MTSHPGKIKTEIKKVIYLFCGLPLRRTLEKYCGKKGITVKPILRERERERKREREREIEIEIEIDR